MHPRPPYVWVVAALAQGLSGVQVTTSPIVVVDRFRASPSAGGAGITSRTLPSVAAGGIVDSNWKRRASIQRVPCSHRSEYRRSYKSPATNSASVEAIVRVVGGSRPEFWRTRLRSVIA